MNFLAADVTLLLKILMSFSNFLLTSLVILVAIKSFVVIFLGSGRRKIRAARLDQSRGAKKGPETDASQGRLFQIQGRPVVTLESAALSKTKVLRGRPTGTEVAAWKDGDESWEAAGKKRRTRKK